MSNLVDQLADRVRAHSVDLARRASQLVLAETQAGESRRTSAMVDATTVSEPALEDTRVTLEVKVDVPYAKFQDEGTGIYGPSGARIFPKTAKALRFDSPAAGGIVFARSVAGAPGRHFFHDVMPDRWHNSLAASTGGG